VVNLHEDAQYLLVSRSVLNQVRRRKQRRRRRRRRRRRKDKSKKKQQQNRGQKEVRNQDWLKERLR
jgi:hypothetical protein